MSRITLLFCHRDPFLVANRLRLLTRTGTTGLHLLYGGRERAFPAFIRTVRALTGLPVPAHCIRGRSPAWKWANTDLGVLDWYRHAGHAVEFTSVAVVDWDMVVYAPVRDVYAHVPQDTVGLSGLIPLREREAVWPWLEHQPYRDEWRDLQRHLRDAHGWDAEPHLCIGPGFVLPKAFLSAYAEVSIPDLCHDEIRLPAYAQALGFALGDTRLYRSWTDPQEQRIFNADRLTVRRDLMRRELADPEGRRVFHPHRAVVPTAGLRMEPGVALSPHADLHDRLMRAASLGAGAILTPPRRARSYWVRFRGRVLGRRVWPAVPRAERPISWHE